MNCFRYSFRFDTESNCKVVVKFNNEFETVDQVQEFANYDYRARRAWARYILAEYRDSGFTVLQAGDFNMEYGRNIAPYFPVGATALIVPSIEDNSACTTLVIQVFISRFLAI